jgi:hypothetical protein
MLLERLRVSSTPGSGAKTQGRIFNVKQNASMAGGRVVSEIFIEALREEEPGISRETLLSNRISLASGQIGVVGETGLRGALKGMSRDARTALADETLFFVLKASVDDAAPGK